MAEKMRTSVRMLDTNYFKILEGQTEFVEGEPIVEKTTAQRVTGRGDDADDADDAEAPSNSVVVINRRPRVQTARAAGNDSYEKHKESQKKYYESNKEDLLAKQKAYRQSNKEAQNRRKIIYQLNNSAVYKNRIQQKTVDKYSIKLVNGVYV